ncbi:MAG TPA: hypothetical protein VF210_19160 [Pseudomonadales bacterium]
MTRRCYRMTVGPLLLAISGCLSHGAPDSVHRRLESDLRRSCLAHVNRGSADAARLAGARWHAACVAWAHRQAERLAAP